MIAILETWKPTAALTLHASGFDVRVLERARTLQPLGVGINLLPRDARRGGHPLA